ncbi:hypothetical protein IR165_06920 [Sanguibacter inulinus]|uniref:Uncharacterized protein n=2 Tax=Sanguibacter inulinus TaxID=60922 RepID=A0A853ERY8_9MICO|nr:hypothetical protein [Sanguibacter inulinus]NYS93261.1 hypothetical protein [Sanguibacter inulinus]
MEDLLSENPLVLLVIACEIGFWVVLAAGLVARYPLRRPRLGGILLVCVPVVDLVLVTASVVDVARGTPPGFSHGLAAVYLGFTVAFGHTLVRWADVRFAHRYAGGPAPVRGPRDGLAALPRELKDFGRALVAAVIAGGVLLVLSLVAGTGIPPVAEWMEDPLWSWTGRIGVVLAVWFVTGPVWVALGPRSGGRDAAGESSGRSGSECR